MKVLFSSGVDASVLSIPDIAETTLVGSMQEPLGTDRADKLPLYLIRARKVWLPAEGKKWILDGDASLNKKDSNMTSDNPAAKPTMAGMVSLLSAIMLSCFKPF